MRRDITFLASDLCEGRGPGTHGIDLAADYIAEQFHKAGLKPGANDGSYFQPFTINANVLDEPAVLSLSGPFGQTIALRQGRAVLADGPGRLGQGRVRSFSPATASPVTRRVTTITPMSMLPTRLSFFSAAPPFRAKP